MKKLASIVRNPHFLICILCVLIHTIIFYGVIITLPQIVSGNAFISRDELVPIFNINSQFIDQIIPNNQAIDLTSSDEVRLSYSFWTAWVRYGGFLPISFILLGALSLYLLTLSSYTLITNKHYTRNQKMLYLFFCFLSALPIYIILLYAKITTFYTLIIGFSLFCLALSQLIKYTFLRSDIKLKNIVVISLLVLLNPAVHYHFLFYFVAIIIGVLTMIYRRNVIYILKNYFYIFLMSGVPYVLLIYASISRSGLDVSNQIPVNYWGIYYNSLPINYLLSLNTTAQADVREYGRYVIPTPRILGTISLIVALMGAMVGFISNRSNSNANSYRSLYVLMLMLFIIGIFMSLGYKSTILPSFHEILTLSSGILNEIPFIGKYITSLEYSFLNVLRFPHRFQFIYFYALTVLTGLSLIVIYNLLVKYFKSYLSNVLIICTMSVVVISPFLFDKDYRNVLFGDGLMNGYLKPYEVPDSLKEIKSILHNNDKKLFILPSLESGRALDQNGDKYTFIDKTLIYYLNTPTYYYGAGANTTNKIMAERVYNAVVNDQTNNSWTTILSNSLSVNYILIPKNTSINKKQIQYYPLLESKINQKITVNKDISLKFDSPEYALYKINTKVNEKNNILIDVDQEEINDTLNELDDEQIIFPIQLQSLSSKAKNKLIAYTDDPDRTCHTIQSLKKNNFIIPNKKLLPYQKNVVESSIFSTTGTSLDVFNDAGNQYNLFGATIPSMINLTTPQFVGTTKNKGTVDVSVPLIKSRTSDNLYLHIATYATSIKVVINGERQIVTMPTQAKKDIGLPPDYKYVRIKGNTNIVNHVSVINDSRKPIYVEGILVGDVCTQSKKIAEGKYEFTY